MEMQKARSSRNPKTAAISKHRVYQMKKARLMARLLRLAGRAGSEQADDLAILDVDGVGRRRFRQTRHGHDLTADRHDEFGAGREAHLADRDRETGRRALGVGVGRERVLRLGDADRKLAEAHLFPGLE